jgi:hypothetical protein
MKLGVWLQMTIQQLMMVAVLYYSWELVFGHFRGILPV